MTRLVLLSAVMLAATTAVRAQGAVYDLSFGDGGRVRLDLGVSLREQAQAVAVQADGKVVIAGYGGWGSAAVGRYVLVRLLSDGTLDPSFGDRGRVLFDYDGTDGAAHDVAIQADGRIVIVGRAAGYGVLRLLADGTPDLTFGVGGRATVAVSGEARAVAIQPDGRIVVAGDGGSTQSGTDFQAVRLDANGSLDFSFSGDGIAHFDIAGEDDHAHSVTLQADGAVILAGEATPGTTSGSRSDIAVVRVTADGALDSTFGQDGVVLVDVTTRVDVAYDVAVQVDGRIIAAGFAQTGSTSISGKDFVAVRLTAQGALDASFDGDGIALFAGSTGHDEAHGIGIQAGGRVVLVGYGSHSGTGYDVHLVGLTAAGAPDPTFGTNGFVTLDAGTLGEEGTCLALLPDGRVMTAGFGRSPGVANNYDFLVARWTAAGALDETFAGSGWRLVRGIGTGADAVHSVAIAADGDIIAAGHAFTGVMEDFAVARVEPDGTPDATFGIAGHTFVDFGGNSRAQVTRLDANGFIVAAGTASVGANKIAVARLAPNGELDASFGVGGRVTIEADDSADGSYGSGLALDGAGRILVAGRFTFSDVDAAVVRLTATGAPDSSFGGDGRVRIDSGGRAEDNVVVEWQADGRIVVAGTTSNFGSDYRFFVARLLADGALDTSFGGDGLVIADFGGNPVNGDPSDVRGIALEPDGRITLVGDHFRFVPTGIDYYLALARLLPDGTLDSSFDDDGRALVTFWNEAFEASAVEIAPNGQIVAAGQLGPDDIGVARVNADGSLDASFGDGGRMVVNLGTSQDRGGAAALQSDGRIVVGGSSAPLIPGVPDFTLARLLPVAVAADPPAESSSFRLKAHPNPTDGRTFIAYALDEPGVVLLTIHDMLGREVAVLAHGRSAAGLHEIDLDTRALAPGAYVVRAQLAQRTRTMLITVVR